MTIVNETCLKESHHKAVVYNNTSLYYCVLCKLDDSYALFRFQGKRQHESAEGIYKKLLDNQELDPTLVCMVFINTQCN